MTPGPAKSVFPAKGIFDPARTGLRRFAPESTHWIPAFAGMTERGAGGGGSRGVRSVISSACGFPKQDFWFALEIFFCLAIGFAVSHG
jgi:hypothetical protein